MLLNEYGNRDNPKIMLRDHNNEMQEERNNV